MTPITQKGEFNVAKWSDILAYIKEFMSFEGICITAAKHLSDPVEIDPISIHFDHLVTVSELFHIGRSSMRYGGDFCFLTRIVAGVMRKHKIYFIDFN